MTWMKRKLISIALLLVLPFVVVTAMIGCGGSDTNKTSLFDHEHTVPAHAPRSLWDLGRKIRSRLELMESFPDDAEAKSELNDLVSWSAEIAADTNIGEERWMPIYELSEEIRVLIKQNPSDWSPSRQEKAIRLCQLTDDAWRSLAPDQRVERYLGHDHSPDHDHGDGHSHDHSGHDHSGHDHGDHDHHGEKDHDHAHRHDDLDDAKGES